MLGLPVRSKHKIGGDVRAGHCRVSGLWSSRGKVTSPWCISEELCEGMRFQEVSATSPSGDLDRLSCQSRGQETPTEAVAGFK